MLTSVFWPFWGSKKVVFWTFWKLFWSCSGIVRALFSDLENPHLGVFTARKVEKTTSKIKFFCQNLASERVILGLFWGQKVTFLDFSKVVQELFRKCLGIVFGLKRPTFGCICSSKGWQMTSKIKIFGQILALWEGHFNHFWGQKSGFWDFFKVVLELLRKCLDIVFGL